jgi:excinuclease ABC subunit C
MFREADSCEMAIAFVRAGRVVDSTSFSMRRVELPDEEVIAAVLSQYYGEDGPASEAIPDEILVPILPESASGVEEWLSERRGRKAKLISPKRGARADLLRLAMDNAQHAFTEKRRTATDMKERLADIQTKLRLPSVPSVIECCDISHLGGLDTVGGVVRMLDGEFHKAGYRSFYVRDANAGDDYAAIFEVLSRRFRRALDAEAAKATDVDAEAEERDAGIPSESNADGWAAPDLFVVDGGRGQLAMALAAARELGLHDLPIVALAKEREDVSGQTLTDRVYLPGQKNGISVRPNSALVILARLRDEAHRYSNHVRERLGLARRLRSQLDEAIGIGESTRRKLLTHFGTVQAIRDAAEEELRDKCGLTRRQVRALREALVEHGVGADTNQAPGTSEQMQSDLAPESKNE